jgi:hypothetical protein
MLLCCITALMFSVSSTYDRDLIRAFFTPQVPPEVLSQRIPGEPAHLRSLDAALNRSKVMLAMVSVSLQDAEELSPDLQETYGFHLSAGCMMLAGALDGMAMLVARSTAQQTQIETDLSKVTFRRATFSSAEAIKKKKLIMGLRSPQQPPPGAPDQDYTSQDMYLDFFSVTNFWKHYMPLPPRPKFFERQRIFDFQLEFGGAGVTIDDRTAKVRANNSGRATQCECSGPVIHDLLIPTYNAACDLLHILAAERGVHVRSSLFHVD